ncbi:hypothetical protein [Desulfatibacillum aliphaticivorans]|uniref:hypothetical protein n=1 Tax=Desulfatibacillum aliphaticivorans TaxID=218208 RepID=UPI000481B0D8|nr:hypothetical protein [Desulfatibacillum aliphaticivorans]
MAYTKGSKQGGYPLVKPTRNDIKAKKDAEKAMAKRGASSDFRAPNVDLDYLDVHSLVSELSVRFNQKNDVGVIRAWFRRKRIEVQTTHLQALSNQVAQVRSQAQDLVEFKAQLMTQREVLAARMVEIVEASQFAVDRQREEHQTFLTRQHGDRERVFSELERLKAENDKLIWQAEQERQTARLIQLRGDLIQKALSELDFQNLDMRQVFVIIEMIKDSRTEADIFNAEAKVDFLKAEARKMEAQARQEEAEADFKAWNFEENKKEL